MCQCRAETLEVIQPFPADRIAEHIIMGTFLQERISELTQIVDVPVPKNLEEPDVPVP